MPIPKPAGPLMAWHVDDRLGTLINLTPWVGFDTERDPESPMPVYLRLGRGSRGQYVCTGLIVGDIKDYGWSPREVNAAVLRGIRIPELIARALRSGDIPDEYGVAVRQLLDAVPTTMTHPGRAGYADDHYVAVADLYRRGEIESPGSPTKWVTQQLQQSPPTIRRWLAEARRRGHLAAPATNDRGEQP